MMMGIMMMMAMTRPTTCSSIGIGITQQDSAGQNNDNMPRLEDQTKNVNMPHSK